MILLFTGSITIPIVLGGIRLALRSPDIIFGHKILLNKSRRVLYSIMTILLVPFHSAILHFKMHYIQLKLNSHPQNRKLLEEKDILTFHQRNFAKVELGLETIYQMVLLQILIFASSSGTRIYSDLIFVLFEDKENSFLSIEVFQMIGYLSFGYSFISCVRSHLVMLSAEREYFPFASKCTAGLCTLFGITKRIMAMILFFAPSLGLFDLLYHWSIEQTKWNPALIHVFVDAEENIQFGDSHQISWNLIDRWTKNTSVDPLIEDSNGKLTLANPEYYLAPPPITVYTLFTLKEWFYIFCGMLFFNMVLIIIVKQKFSFDYSHLNFDMILHALENTNITYNSREWDAPAGSAKDHKRRMLSNHKEGIALILVSCIFNMLHLIPLSILGKIISISF